jgi:hypothetical protein
MGDVTVRPVVLALPRCVVEPPYVADMVCAPLAVGVNVAEQLRFPATTEHVVVPNVPARLLENVTEALGGDFVPSAVSVTVAVQIVLGSAFPRSTGLGAHVTLVPVVRLITVNEKVPKLLANWIGAVSPAYVALSE